MERALRVQEWVMNTTARLEADFSNIGTMIHRFPQGLRGIGGQDNRYIVPTVVAIGPYHHGLEHLREMEDVKRVVAHYFCEQSGHSVEEVYGRIAGVAEQARGCYAKEAVVAHFSHDEFAVMMFLDGCFLLRYMDAYRGSDLLTNWMILSKGPCVQRDIFLLENQLPWFVLEALMEYAGVDVYNFVHDMSANFDATSVSNPRLSRDEFNNNYRPAHLLGALRYYQIGSMPPQDLSNDELTYHALASSAIELAEIGIKLTASNRPWFADMAIHQRGDLFGKLSLTPLFVNDVTACWLVNMAAFEECTSINYPHDGLVITTYISFLAMLIDKEDDVHNLREKHLVRSFFSNQELLDFFNGLARHVKLGRRYHFTLDRIDKYKRERPIRIALHKFLYINFKIIVALLSISGVLVGIFKTILSLKHG